MNPRGSFLGFIGAVLFAASPFIVFAVVATQVPEAEPRWPGPAVVAASFDDVLQEVAIVDARDPATVIAFPVDTVLRVSGIGEVRAATAMRVGGTEALARGFSELLEEEVAHHIAGSGATIFDVLDFDVDTNLGDRVTQIEAILSTVSVGTGRLVNAPGDWFELAGLPAYHVDRSALFAELAGDPVVPVPSPGSVTATVSPAPTPSPTSTPTSTVIDRSEITVEVLNAGAPSGSAGSTGDQLTEEGFDVISVGNAEEPTVGVKVYYVDDPAKGEEVASVLDATAEPIPDNRSTEADVLVLVARE